MVLEIFSALLPAGQIKRELTCDLPPCADAQRPSVPQPFLPVSQWTWRTRSLGNDPT